MVELNGCEPKKIKVLGPYTFSIGDTSGLSDYQRGGVVTQVKMPVTHNFLSLADALKSPSFVVTDFAKMHYPAQLHVAFTALHAFIEKEGREPKPWDAADAQTLISLARIHKSACGLDEDLDENVITTFSNVCAGRLAPMSAVIGGVVAQEVMKASSGKFSPVFQWLYFDAVECLPAERPVPPPADSTSRYSRQEDVFGVNFQNKLGALRYFVVGTFVFSLYILFIKSNIFCKIHSMLTD